MLGSLTEAPWADRRAIVEDKKIEDMTEEEFEDFMRGIKWERFMKWAKTIDTNEDSKKDMEEISKRTGIKKTAPLAFMAVGFFAGVEVGAEIMKKFLALKEENKNPAGAATPTGPAN